MKPKLTNEGIAALIREMNGDGIVFSKFKIGNGAAPADYKVLTDLQNPLAEIALNSMVDASEGFVKLEGTFNNSEVANSFEWREVGIFIQDPDNELNDLLYAYGHTDLEEVVENPTVIPAYGTEIYELKLIYNVYIADAENITAIIAESATFASKAALESHVSNTANPHRVTKEQIGLGNVPNVSTDNQKPTITNESATLTTLESGDTLYMICKKVKKAISDLKTHLANSTIHITGTERTKWNGKADGTHKHPATDITSGTLGVARGGTGGATPAAAANNILAQGATQIGGNLKINQKNRGYYLTDKTDSQYSAIHDNGSNLWLGTNEQAARHHSGHLYLSAGYDEENHTGFQTAFIGVPNSSNTGASLYAIMHSGNYSSDIRLKENIKDTEVESAMGFLNNVKIRSFDWKETGEHQAIGFIADELELLDPKLAEGGGYTDEGGINAKWVNSFYLMGYVVKALQELSAENKTLRERIKNLEEA